jgi:protoporphyrin/coproporphyrin ferrochelatase
VTYDSLLLASFGGPEGPDEVMPFLERVTAGRGVPRERLEEVSHHYLALGGVSPINEQNRQLMTALRAELDSRGVDLPLYWGNRNSAPFFADTLRAMSDAGHTSVLAIATSAYSSYSGCRQYRENLAVARTEAGLDGQVEIAKVHPYYEREGFTGWFRSAVHGALDGLRASGIADAETVVLFTTHSIPTAMAIGSGPDSGRTTALPGLYERQHLEVAEQVMAGTAVAWRLVFQSRSGPPQVPWLEPDINDALREAADQGAKAVVVAPIGFISDHVEVIWDLDHEARETAEELGIALVRVPTPGTDPGFVSALADTLVEALAGATPSTALCTATCCANLRVALPTVPGVASEDTGSQD